MPKGLMSRTFYGDDQDWKTLPDGVKYAQFSSEEGNPDRPLIVLSQLPPGYVEQPHTHDCDYVEVVMKGSITVGKAMPMVAGDVRTTKAGVGYGPLIAGPEGCTRMTIFDTARGSVLRPLGSRAEAGQPI